MEQALKERLVGATVLVILVVIFVPMLLDDTSHSDIDITQTNIPEKPESSFSSRIIPLQEETIEETKLPETENVTAEKKTDVDEKEAVAKMPEIEKLPALTSDDDKPVDQGVGLNAWVVQLGSFSSEANAQALNKKLRDAGYPAFVEPLRQKNSVAYRVRVGPELKYSDAQSLLESIKKSMKLDGIVISYP